GQCEWGPGGGRGSGGGGLRLAARAVEHAGENVLKSHVCLLYGEPRNFYGSPSSAPWRPCVRIGCARVGNGAVNDQPVPDEQDDECTESRGDEAGALVVPIPADRLADEGGQKGACDS